MAFTFRIIFSGLCAFVPDVENISKVKNRRADRWWVLLPRLSRGRKVPPNDHSIAPHYPTLSFLERNLAGGSAGPDLWVTPVLDPDRQGLRFFQGEVMQISTGGKPPLQVKRGTSRASLDRLPKMSQSCAEAACVRDENVFETGPGRIEVREDRIAAAILLDHGLLRTHNLRRDAAGRELQFAMKPAVTRRGKATARTMANEVCLEIGGLEGRVELSFCKQGGTRTLLLRPDPEHPDDDVEVRVMNWELETILGLGEGSMLEGGQDRDFLIFYELARDEAAATTAKEDAAAMTAGASTSQEATTAEAKAFKKAPHALLAPERLVVPHLVGGAAAGGPRQGCGGTEFEGHTTGP